jgi:glycosyltransferase involved in cell wall biosynthesis
MSKKVALFFPEDPYPPKSGLHKRALDVMGGFREIGCEVHLLSSALTTPRPWQAKSAISLKDRWVTAIHIHQPSRLDHRYRKLLDRYYTRAGRPMPFDTSYFSPPGMRYWFARTLGDLSPDVVVMTYARWDRLIDHRRLRSKVRVIDTIDLMSLNHQMWQLLDGRLPPPPMSAERVDDQLLQEDFFLRRRLAALPKEYRIFDKYTSTIAIADEEAESMQRHTHKTRVIFIPMTYEPHYFHNSYSGPALFTTGPNPFNLQGYFYFVKRVLPLVRSRAPSFGLQVTGHCCGQVDPESNVVLSGFVADLRPVYEAARFLACPVFGGTGQQVKIVEAMAHGLPVVALRAAAARSPLRHGVNGLIAENAEEFAEHVLRLWHDPQLCRRLGEAARDTVAAEVAPARLKNALSSLVTGG